MCSGCIAKDCGTCSNCKDMVKFGGLGKKKRVCVQRSCVSLVSCRSSKNITTCNTCHLIFYCLGVNNKDSTIKESHVPDYVTDTTNEKPDLVYFLNGYELKLDDFRAVWMKECLNDKVHVHKCICTTLLIL